MRTIHIAIATILLSSCCQERCGPAVFVEYNTKLQKNIVTINENGAYVPCIWEGNRLMTGDTLCTCDCPDNIPAD